MDEQQRQARRDERSRHHDPSGAQRPETPKRRLEARANDLRPRLEHPRAPVDDRSRFGSVQPVDAEPLATPRREQVQGAHGPVRPRPGRLTLGFLSFLWPGLGHAALRRRQAALILAIPTLIVVLVWLALYVTRGSTGFAISLLSPSFAWALMASFVVIGIWRLVAVADAARQGASPAAERRRLTGVGLGAIVLGIIAPHAIGAYVRGALTTPGPRSTSPAPVTSADASSGPAASLAPGQSAVPSAGPGRDAVAERPVHGPDHGDRLVGDACPCPE